MKNVSPHTAIFSLLALTWMACANPNLAGSDSTPKPKNTNMHNSSISEVAVKPNDHNLKVDNRLVTATTDFGFKLFEHIASQASTTSSDPNQNIFISPSSVAIALSMIYNGADGETQRAIGKTLEMERFKLNEVNRFYQSLQQSLTDSQSGVELNIANSLWTRQDVPLKQSFLDRIEQFYQAEIQNLDFSNPDSINVINAWVRAKTKDKIVKIIDSLDADIILILVNAVYFKGAWQSPFKKSLTTPSSFTRGDGKKVIVPMMMQSRQYQYYETPTFQAISLPYKSKRFGMQIFLPKPNSSLQEFREQLNHENWQDWRLKMQLQQVDLRLPRFKIEYETELNTILSKMGMAIAFTLQANFQNISQIPSYISDVKHKTFVEVNEEGTEAAAVTAIASRSSSLSMTVDRPFFFAISDRQTGAIIFMGTINDPTGK